MNKAAVYQKATVELLDRTEHENDRIANLANASAILHLFMENINWVGFYLCQEDQLVLGPFQGRPACVRIAAGKGVCGTAFATDTVQRIADVHQFPGHIACDERSKSEIVLPIHHQGRPVAVLDIDSPVRNRFDEIDQKYLEEIVRILENSCRW